MQHQRLILAGAGVFLLMLGSLSYGADPVTTAPTASSSPQQIYLIRENPFFNMHIEKAVQHAREAEIAGNLGEAELLQEHARISLMQAHEAQRAGNVPGLNEGIANLKKALSPTTWAPQASTQTPSAAMPQASTQTPSAEVPQASAQTPSAEMPQASMQTPSAEVPQASAQTPSAEVPQPSTQTSSAQATGAKAQSGTQRADAAVRSATDAVREARKNLSEAGGLKYKEIKPQTVKTVAQ